MSKESRELTIRVKGYTLPFSSEQIGSIRLLEFQERVRHAKERLVLLNAPTGSGKTLAYLLHGIENFPTSIILYPTKELMEDQARNIVKLLNSLGRQVTKVEADEEKSNVEVEHGTTKEYDVVLLVANGDTLRYWADKEESSEGKAFLNKLMKYASCKHLIILTNVDILYLLLRYSFFATSEIIKMVATRGKALLVVDEFHLYFGFSLLVLVNLIKLLVYATSNSLIQRVMFSSATGIDLSKIFNEKIEVIEAKYYDNDHIAKEARVARYDTTLKIKPIDYIVYNESDIDKVFSEVVTLYESITSKNKNLDESAISVLVILNSIVSCEALFNLLKSFLKSSGGLRRISSYVPRKERQVYVTEKTKILVGTSAVEVGIDFDAYSLVFEASDAYSFIQRFGRVSRKRDGEAVVFVPNYSFSKIKDELGGRSEVSYSEFVKIVEKSLFKSRNYEEFSVSPYAIALVAGVVAAIEKRISEQKGQKIDDEDELYEKVSDDKHTEIYRRIFLDNFVERSLKIDNDLNLYRFFKFSLSNASARGNLASIPCYLEEFDTFALISIMDLEKFDFDFIDKSDFNERKRKLPHSYSFENTNYLAIVHRISLKKDKFQLDFIDLPFGKILTGREIVNKIANVITTLNQKYIIELRKVIGSSYGILGFEEDWRLTHLRVKVNNENYVLYLGADAFLYYYLRNKDKYS
ncbi:MAG: type I-D CRISPR-associated helicase Cas3' [Thermoproteota archaeon]